MAEKWAVIEIYGNVPMTLANRPLKVFVFFTTANTYPNRGKRYVTF